MGTQGGGPPNKWAAFSTAGMKSPDELAQQLSNLFAQGFTGDPFNVPAPDNTTATWIAVPGYKK